MKKKQEEVVQPVIPVEEQKKDKSVISSQDVEEVVSGDENALSEQMERIKNLTKEQQLEAIEAEKRKKLELERQKQQEILKKQQEEARKKAEAEALRKKQEEERIRQEQERIKQEQELLRRKQEEERLKKEQEAKRLQEQQHQQLQQQQVKPVEEVSNQQVIPKEEKTDDSKGGPSTLKTVLAIFLFIGIMAMIYFMPEINNFISARKLKNQQDEITSGVLTCKSERSTDNLDVSTNAQFYFTDKKLYKLSYTVSYTGDKVKDKDELTDIYNKCILLEKETDNIDGVAITCSNKDGTSSNKQDLDYEKLNLNEVTSAYTEAGGVYPAEFKNGEDIDSVESQMVANQYTCTKR